MEVPLRKTRFENLHFYASKWMVTKNFGWITRNYVQIHDFTYFSYSTFVSSIIPGLPDMLVHKDCPRNQLFWLEKYWSWWWCLFTASIFNWILDRFMFCSEDLHSLLEVLYNPMSWLPSTHVDIAKLKCFWIYWSFSSLKSSSLFSIQQIWNWSTNYF